MSRPGTARPQGPTSEPGTVAAFARVISRQRRIAIDDNRRWGRMFMALSVAGVAPGTGAWFLHAPVDRDRELGAALGEVMT